MDLLALLKVLFGHGISPYDHGERVQVLTQGVDESVCIDQWPVAALSLQLTHHYSRSREKRWNDVI